MILTVAKTSCLLMIVSGANWEKVEVGVGWCWEIVECIARNRHIISFYLSFLISTSFCLPTIISVDSVHSYSISVGV